MRGLVETDEDQPVRARRHVPLQEGLRPQGPPPRGRLRLPVGQLPALQDHPLAGAELMAWTFGIREVDVWWDGWRWKPGYTRSWANHRVYLPSGLVICWPRSLEAQLKAQGHRCPTPPEPKLGDRWICPDCGTGWSASLHGFEEVAWERTSRASPYVD